MWKRSLVVSSLATLAGVAAHYVFFFALGTPLLTEAVAEWIMARTPSRYAVWMLAAFGPAAKPFAVTGGLATLGFAVWLVALAAGAFRRLVLALPAAALAGAAAAVLTGSLFEYSSAAGQLAFWVPAVIAVAYAAVRRPPAESPERRRFLVSASRLALPATMGAGVRPAGRRTGRPVSLRAAARRVWRGPCQEAGDAG
jgi:hypothetical protein